MRASRHRRRFKQHVIRIPFKNFESRLGADPVFLIYHCAMFVADVDSQWMLGRVLIPFWIALRDGAINFLRLMILELNAE